MSDPNSAHEPRHDPQPANDYSIFQPKSAARVYSSQPFSVGATSWHEEPESQPGDDPAVSQPAAPASNAAEPASVTPASTNTFRPQPTGYRSALTDTLPPESAAFARRTEAYPAEPAAGTSNQSQSPVPQAVEQRRGGLGAGSVVTLLLLSILLSSIFGALAGYTVFNINNQQAVAARKAAENATAQQLPPALDDSPLVSMVKKSSPAVVTVINQLNTQRATTTQPEALGSGFIFRKEGYIMTNNHVVENQKQIYVLFSDGKQAEAKLVGVDRYADIAVIKIDEKEVPEGVVLDFGDSGELQPGQRVFAIGSALGDFRNSVTQGIVSATGRRLPLSASTKRTLDDLIQTDTPINHGNSGGPLLNTRGQVIGINTAIMRYPLGLEDQEFRPNQIAEGIGFAVPSNLAVNVADRLINEGKVARPFIGVDYNEFTKATARQGSKYNSGVLVRTVGAGTPAEQAGLQRGDVITAINDTPITEDQPMNRLLMRYKVGDEVKLSILRNDQQMTLTLKLGERPESVDSQP